MQKEEKEFQLNKLDIFSLKNQKAFDKANRVGVKKHSKSMILITYFEKSNDVISPAEDNNEQNIELVDELDAALHSNSLISISPKILIHLGLKISKKIGKAVIRNKIRRRIKAIIYELPKSLALSVIHNRVIVIIPKRGLDKLPYSALKSEIIRAL